ncbi:hypothetical protein [Gorillibacterium massiliense]|uniref:hypothetical protein n=1 Tax=Gorillibacterium massiliense TaxID=1280390 RepID=UPI0004B7FC54|nr:hypothetical protein [Gorillibacterium massiliense]
MAENIQYKDEIIMDTFRDEVSKSMGENAWNALTDGIGVPDIEKEGQQICKNMRELMNRLDDMAEPKRAKEILTHVRHGLKREQFAWAKEKFAQCGSDIDSFIACCYEEELGNFIRLRDAGETFYGQPVTDEVLNFVQSQPGMLAAVRSGSELHITAFPYDMVNYLAENDERKKRYHACHCPFARESILHEGAEVSKTLCYCSLGHAKIMWEAIFERELDGDVVESALGGSTLCKHVIYLPEE